MTIVRRAIDRVETPTILWAGAATALTWALYLFDSGPSGRALLLVVGALALTMWGILGKNPRRSASGPPPRFLVEAMFALLLAQFTALWLAPPSWLLPTRPPGGHETLTILLALAVAAAALLLAVPRRRLVPPFVVLLAVALAAAAWIFRVGGHPYIDVHEFQQQGCAELLAGRNPYAMTFANMYPDQPFYAPELVRDGRLQVGFSYPPLSLYLALPGCVLLGDHRYSQAAALVLGAGVLFATRPTRPAALAMALLILAPATLFILQNAWTEPFVVLGLTAVLWCAVHRPPWLPWAFGAWLATKQYMFLVVPLGVLLLPRPWTLRSVSRLLGPALGVATALTLPWLLLEPVAFLKSVVALQVMQPFRADSLSLMARFSRDGIQPFPSWVCFVAAGIAAFLAVRRAPRTPAGFCAATAAVFLAFLIVNKQAFWNYYLPPLAALWCAVALGSTGGDETEGG